MTEARAHILSKLNRAIVREDIGAGSVDDRIATHNTGPLPKRGQDPDQAALAARFVQESDLAGSDIQQLASRDDVPAVVAAYLRSKNLPPELRVSSDDIFGGVPWEGEPGLTIRDGVVDAADGAALSAAFAGVAETGTLIMASSPDNPAMHAFVPLVHMVILPESRISGNYEAVWADLRHQFGAQVMPRMLNMITGPSRTADIEQTLLMGAHGPQSLLIMVIGDL